MSFKQKISETLNQYISVPDLLKNISTNNNESLYDVILYLLHNNIDALELYYIDKVYIVRKAHCTDVENIKTVLTNLADVIRLGDMNDDDWIYNNEDSLDFFSDGTGLKVKELLVDLEQLYFKKTDLLDCEPLKEVIDFSATKKITLPSTNENIQNLRDRIVELLYELEDEKALVQTLKDNHEKTVRRLRAQHDTNLKSNDIKNGQLKELTDELGQAENSQSVAYEEPKQKEKSERNRDDEIVVYLSFLLAQKSKTFGKADGSINASQVGKAINGIAQALGLDKDDMHGLKRPDARINDLIKKHENLLVKFKELVKKQL